MITTKDMNLPGLMIGEILDAFEKAKTRQAKKEVLEKYNG